jgi:hypothetical protein
MKSYYNRKDSNYIKRDEFERYRVHMSRQVDTLILLNLRLVNPKEFQEKKLSWMIQADIERYQELKQNLQVQRMAETNKQLSLMLTPPTNGQLEPNLPTYYPEDDEIDSDQDARRGGSHFLFPDMQSRNMEMKLRILVLRTQTAIQAGRYEKSMQLCNEAEAIDQQLKVPCLHGKVCFWKGFTSLKMGQPDRAVQYFEDAKAAKGHYREGEHAQVWADFVRTHSKSPGWRISKIDLLENLGVVGPGAPAPGE